ncbi:hypothetical protein BaRGS_00012963, partial [Batillaria attramentaria]
KNIKQLESSKAAMSPRCCALLVVLLCATVYAAPQCDTVDAKLLCGDLVSLPLDKQYCGDVVEPESLCGSLMAVQQKYCHCINDYKSVNPTSGPDGQIAPIYPADTKCPNGVCPIPKVECPEGWEEYNSSCYMVVKSAVCWRTAMKKCKYFGGYLAEISDEMENTFIGNLAKKTFGYCRHEWDSYAWIGASDSGREGEWQWMESQEPADYMNWNQGEPNSFMGKEEDCAELYSHKPGFTWNDESCWHKRNYVCEK